MNIQHFRSITKNNFRLECDHRIPFRFQLQQTFWFDLDLGPGIRYGIQRHNKKKNHNTDVFLSDII